MNLEFNQFIKDHLYLIGCSPAVCKATVLHDLHMDCKYKFSIKDSTFLYKILSIKLNFNI